MGLKIAVVDLEATNNDYDKKGRIIQIGAVIIEKGKIIDKKSMLINPECEIPSVITQLTGITQEQVLQAPTFSKVAKLWYHILKDCIFVAHNIEFDYAFLQKHFAEEGIQYEALGIDTVKLSRIFFPEAPAYNLSELAMYLNIPFGKAHDAFDDAMTTTYLLHEIATRVDQLSMDYRIMLRNFIKKLPHNEIELMKSPQSFMLTHPPLYDVETVYDVLELEFSEFEKKEANYILEKWRHNEQLVLEHSRHLFTTRQKLALLHELNQETYSKQTIIICENRQQLEGVKFLLSKRKVSEFKTAIHYLHQPTFKKLVKKTQGLVLTTNEVIAISAILYWQSYADTIDLGNLNLEHYRINGVIKKFLSPTDIHQVKVALPPKQYPYILTTYEALKILMEKMPNPNLYQLVVLDLPSLVLSIRHFNTLHLPLDVWRKKCESLQERLNFLKLGQRYRKFSEQLEVTIKAAFSLEKLLLKTLNKNVTPKQRHQLKQVEFCVSFENEYYDKLNSRLKIVEKEVMKLNELCISFPEDNLIFSQASLPLIPIDLLSDFMLDDKAQSFWVLKANVKQSKLEAVQIYQQSVSLPVEVSEWLSQFETSVILSDNQYHYRQSTGWHKALHELEYRYHCVPEFKPFELQNISIPIEYVEGKTTYQEIAQFIYDYQEEISQHIIIVVSNKESLNDFVQSCSACLPHYSVQASSFKKLKRNIKNVNRSINIVTKRQLMNEIKSLSTEKVTVLIEGLPFLPLSSSVFYSRTESYQREEVDLFNEIVLPKMCDDLNSMLQHLKEFYCLDNIYLFDNRVFTATYAPRLQKYLENFIKFSILT